MPYCKDTRTNLEADTLLYSYDQKYRYLDWSDERSIFRPELREARLEGVDLPSVLDSVDGESFFSPKMLVVDSSLAEIKTTTQAISALIEIGCCFSVDAGLWFWNPESIESQIIEKIPSEEVEESVEIVLYGGREAQENDSRTRFITTFVFNERVDLNLCNAIKAFCLHRDAILDIFFLKRTLNEDVAYSSSYQLLEEIFSGVSLRLHKYDDLLVNDQLEVRASANVGFTAIKPLSGVLPLASKRYLVVPHVRQELEITVNSSHAKKSIVVSTGCLNSISRGSKKSTAKASFHSVQGGVIYDPTNELYKLIPVNADSTGFNVIADRYNSDQTHVIEREIDSLYFDDAHADLIDKVYLSKVWDLLDVIQPKQFISGDVFNGSSVLYHEQSVLGYYQNRISLVEEIEATTNFIGSILESLPASSKFVCLGSNHHNFFRKFVEKPSCLSGLNSADLVIVLKTMAYMVENTYRSYEGINYGDPMLYLFKHLFEEGRMTTKPVENFNIALRFHGDEYGLGGLGNQSNSKAILGHRHRPKIDKGLMYVGFAGIENPTYQSGLNASAQALALVYKSGKRTLLVNLN